MPLKLAYIRSDGVTVIVHAPPKDHLERLFGPMTDAEYEAHVRERSIPEGATEVQKLPDDWTPPDDRTFRNAWKLSNGVVDVDLQKAKEIAETHANVDKQAVAAAKNIAELRNILKGPS